MHSEQALLGAMLTDVRVRHAVLGLVSPEDLHRPWHGQVLAAMQRLDARGVVPGPVEVYAELQRDPELPRSVSHDAVPLAGLLHAAPRASHVFAYAGIVIGAGIRRRLSLGGGRMRQAAKTTSEPVDDRKLEAAQWVVSQARRDAEACGQRWKSLPHQVRRELPAPARDRAEGACRRVRRVHRREHSPGLPSRHPRPGAASRAGHSGRRGRRPAAHRGSPAARWRSASCC
jgi:replicative DNA helicase